MTLKAIDISSNNGNVDFNSYNGDIIINKLTGGNNYIWKNNKTSESLKHGFLTGVYMFANENGIISNADTQAKYFYNEYRRYQGRVLPIIDYETPINGRSLTQHDMNKLDNIAIAFKHYSGVNPVIYCSKSFILQNVVPKFIKHNCMWWFAQYASMNPTGWQSNPWTDNNKVDVNVVGQQYSSNGHIKGVNGAVDLSIFYITKNNWLKACRPSTN